MLKISPCNCEVWNAIIKLWYSHLMPFWKDHFIRIFEKYNTCPPKLKAFKIYAMRRLVCINLHSFKEITWKEKEKGPASPFLLFCCCSAMNIHIINSAGCAIIVTKCLRDSHQGFIVSMEVCDITHSEKIKDRYPSLHQLVNSL